MYHLKKPLDGPMDKQNMEQTLLLTVLDHMIPYCHSS